MKNENLAERIYVDLKNAGYKIKLPSYQIDGHRIGDDGARQFVISENRGEFGFCEGPALMVDKLSFTDAYQQLLEKIKSLGNELKFYQLVLPRRGVTECRLDDFDRVVTRYIVDYLPNSDDLYARWDVLVAPAN